MIAAESTASMSAENTSQWLYPLWVRLFGPITGPNCTLPSVKPATSSGMELLVWPFSTVGFGPWRESPNE